MTTAADLERQTVDETWCAAMDQAIAICDSRLVDVADGPAGNVARAFNLGVSHCIFYIKKARDEK